MRRFSSLLQDGEQRPQNELAEFHAKLEHYWDTGELPKPLPDAEQLPQAVAKARGRTLPKHLRKYMFELPDAAVAALENAWDLAEFERTGELPRHWNRPGPTDQEGVELSEPRSICPLHDHYEVRATVPFWGGYQNVELTFRHLSRREPMEPFEDVIADYQLLTQDEIESARCHHPACRTPNCSEAHWIVLPDPNCTALKDAKRAVMQLFNVYEARLLTILLPCVFGCAVTCRKVRVPMRRIDERYAPSLLLSGFKVKGLGLPFALGYDTNVDYRFGPTVALGPEAEVCPQLHFAPGGIATL